MMRSGLRDLRARTRPRSWNTRSCALLAHRARVEQDDVGVLRALGQRETVGGGEHVGHLVRVVLVHLAAERADVELLRHGMGPGAGGYPVGALDRSGARIIAKPGRPPRLRRWPGRLQSSPQVPAANPSRRVKRECGAARNLSAPFRSCPRNGKPVRAARHATVRQPLDGKAAAKTGEPGDRPASGPRCARCDALRAGDA